MGGSSMLHVYISLCLTVISGRQSIESLSMWNKAIYPRLGSQKFCSGKGSVGTRLAFRSSEMKGKRKLWNMLLLPFLHRGMWMRNLFDSLHEEEIDDWISVHLILDFLYYYPIHNAVKEKKTEIKYRSNHSQSHFFPYSYIPLYFLLFPVMYFYWGHRKMVLHYIKWAQRVDVIIYMESPK